MAIDTPLKRASVLSAGSFFPGRIPYLVTPDGSDLDDANQRGIVGWHYAGIAGGAAQAVFRRRVGMSISGTMRI